MAKDMSDLGGYREGFALPRAFYTDPAIYERDITCYWNQSWIWVGHISQIPNPGDYFLFDYGPESIIIVRTQSGEVRAHLNVCRHRGSRVCTQGEGNTRLFVCPYHAWSFDLEGSLRGGRAMGPDFDPGEWGLFPAHLRIFEGLIFISTAETPPPIDAGLEQLKPLAAPFDLSNLKVAHEASYPVPANWKLAVENYMECYHCAPSHKEYARSHTLKDPRDVTALDPALKERSRAIGLSTETVQAGGATAVAPGADIYWRRYPLFEGYDTGSQTGKGVAPLLGTLTGYDGGATDLGVGALNNLLIYADHVVGYRFVPRGLQETDIQVVWYVRGNAVEGRDYDREALTWLWHVTSLDDERIIRHNQAGVNSHHFQPGPLSEMEWGIDGFYRGYLAFLQR